MIGEEIVGLHRGSVTDVIVTEVGIGVGEMNNLIGLMEVETEMIGEETVDLHKGHAALDAYLLAEIDAWSPGVHDLPIEGSVIEVFAQALRFSTTKSLVLPRQDDRKCVSDHQFLWRESVTAPSRLKFEKNAKLPLFQNTRLQRAAVMRNDVKSLKKRTRKVDPTKKRARNTLVAQMMAQTLTVLTVIRRRKNPESK